MIRRFARLIVPAIILLVSASGISAQEAKKEAQPNPAEMMQEYIKLSLPGPEHKFLEERVGKWDYVSKMWFNPQEPPSESKGTTEYKMIMGGRYLLQEVEGDFLGNPFKGFGIIGYDKIKKQYTSTWVDNFATSILYTLGTTDSSGKVITYIGEMDDPVTGEKGKKFKSIERIIDKDKHIAEFYDNIPGFGEVKTMEITATRKK